MKYQIADIWILNLNLFIIPHWGHCSVSAVAYIEEIKEEKKKNYQNPTVSNQTKNFTMFVNEELGKCAYVSCHILYPIFTFNEHFERKFCCFYIYSANIPHN